MRALITGCSVFLGDAVARALHARGFTVSRTAAREREGVAALDVLGDPSAIARAIDGADVVVHLAAIRTYGPDVDRAHRVITEGTAAILRAAARARARVILAGSAEEYGPDAPIPYREDGPYAPTSPYGAAKRASVHHALREHADAVTILRPSTAYGPSQPAAMLVASCVRAALAGEDVVIRGGDQRRDLVFVDDVAEAFARAALDFDRIRGREINVASGHAPTVHEVATMIVGLAGRGRVVRDPPSTRAGDVAEMAFDRTRASALLRWEARTPLIEGLARTLASERARAR
jgi:nucleoside-diphosphate-sugar epimerase